MSNFWADPQMVGNLRQRIHAETNHVEAVELCLSVGNIDANGRHVFAELALTHALLAVAEALGKAAK